MSGAPAASQTMAIGSVAELSEPAMALARPGLHPAAFVAQLVEKKLYPDAVRFLAHALPRREAVWWAWMCARRTAGESAPAPVRAALEATEKWIAHPGESQRRAAKAAADAAGLDCPAGCAGLAAFFSGGSLAPPEAPPVPPGEFLTAKAVSGAVIFAAVATEPENAPEKFQNFVVQALDVANRVHLWDPKPEA